MLTQIIRVLVTTAVREITSHGIRQAFHAPKKKENRNSYYKKGRK